MAKLKKIKTYTKEIIKDRETYIQTIEVYCCPIKEVVISEVPKN